MSKFNDDSNRNLTFLCLRVFLHSDWSVSYRSEVKARQDVKPDIRQPPFTDYRQPPVDYRHPPVADYRQPPTLDYRHPPLLDYRQLATDARQFTIPDYRLPPVQVRRFSTAEDCVRLSSSHHKLAYCKFDEQRLRASHTFCWPA